MIRGDVLTFIVHLAAKRLTTFFPTELTARKGALVQRATLPVQRDDGLGGTGGFSLLELVCVMGILTIVAAIALPLSPRATSRLALQTYAMGIASLLKADREAAKDRHTEIVTEVNGSKRLIRSGATRREISVPSDVLFETLISRCGASSAAPTIRFFPSGMSCGGIIKLSSVGNTYEIKVNWLTGGVEIAAPKRI